MTTFRLNSGHGWVYPNASGVKARCGGPRVCPKCKRELEQKRYEEEDALSSDPRRVSGQIMPVRYD